MIGKDPKAFWLTALCNAQSALIGRICADGRTKIWFFNLQFESPVGIKYSLLKWLSLFSLARNKMA